MANEINIFEPRYMAGVVETTPPTKTFLRDTFFSRVLTFATERVDFDLIKGDRRMAAFVHPRSGAQILEKTGYETKSYKPPMIKAYDITYADQLMTRLPGETLYSSKTPAQRAAEMLKREYRKLDDAVTRREEWMAAQVLSNGSLPIVGNGVNEVINFGFKNKVKLSGDKMWGGKNADIKGNLKEWKRKVLIKGFTNVDTLIMGAKAAELFQKDESVREELNNRRIFMGEINPRELSDGVDYIGKWNDPSLKLYTYGEVFLDNWTNPETPELKPLIADNQVIMISSGTDFIRAYGAINYVTDTNQWATVETARHLKGYVEHNPDRSMLEVQSCPLLIPDKVDSWLVAEVC